MTTHSSILGRKIPWTKDPGGLQSMGSQGRPQLKTWLPREYQADERAEVPRLSWRVSGR